MEANGGFTVVGVDLEESYDLAAAAPASVIPIDQDLFEEDGEPFKPGEKNGEAQGIAGVTQKRRVICTIVFSFHDGEDTIVANGMLPIDGSDLGNGRLAIVGGTGKYDKAMGRVDLQTINPKRWIFSF